MCSVEESWGVVVARSKLGLRRGFSVRENLPIEIVFWSSVPSIPTDAGYFGELVPSWCFYSNLWYK